MHPIFFGLGPLHIYAFGIFLAMAFLAAVFLVWREGRNEFEEEMLFDVMVTLTIFAVAGARLFYIFSHFANFNFNFLRWVHFYLYSGFSFWGGVIGGLLGALWFAGRKKVSFWRLADFLVVGAGVGLIFGQIGCFLNNCTVGKPTALPWGLPVLGFLGKRHPIALYDMLVAILVFLVVLWAHRWIFIQRKQREGSAFLVYLLLLSFFSFLLEFLREGGLYFYNLSLNQWTALIFFTGAGVIWFRRLQRGGVKLFALKYFRRKRHGSNGQNGNNSDLKDSKENENDKISNKHS